MKVFKFGGASIKDASSVRNVAYIIRQYDESLIIVVSASGKTTNALEAVVEAALADSKKSLALWEQILVHHRSMAAELGKSVIDLFNSRLNDLSETITNYLTNSNSYPYDFLYDQVVSAGELLSTHLVSDYLNAEGITNTWTDIRTIIQTDDTYRNGKVQWDTTRQQALSTLPPLLNHGHVLTQGFLGGTSKGYTTTLGREGSDYTASILAYCLDAACVMIWKDVPGVLNADPRYFDNATRIDQLSYRDAIELTYFGASVIHPKTIQPLQQKQIPLYVKSFLDPAGPGTVIREIKDVQFLPPMLVLKKNQVLMHLSTLDFSFIAEDHLSVIYDRFARARVTMNLIQNTAISLQICFDRDERKMTSLLAELEGKFDIRYEFPLQLITLKYYNEALLAQIKSMGRVILEERMPQTAQILLTDS